LPDGRRLRSFEQPLGMAEGCWQMVRRSKRRRDECAFPCRCRICDQLLTRASRVPICGEYRSSCATPPEECEICGRTLAWRTVERSRLVAIRASRRRMPSSGRQVTGFMTGRWESGLLSRWFSGGRRWPQTWRCRFLGIGSGSAATTKPGSSPSRWVRRLGLPCLVTHCC
jgi:hypothetical protein